jgi:putative transposase
MRENGAPEKITMDKSSSHKAAIDEINDGREIEIIVR